MSETTGSSYTHAAICIGERQAAGATFSGVTIEPVGELVAAFDHVAVFRQPYAWDQRRKQQLPLIVKQIVRLGPKYNFAGVKAFQEAKTLHADTTHDHLMQYFEGNLQPASQLKGAYFCSEFVAACFILTGIVEPSAAIVYDPSIVAPGEKLSCREIPFRPTNILCREMTVGRASQEKAPIQPLMETRL